MAARAIAAARPFWRPLPRGRAAALGASMGLQVNEPGDQGHVCAERLDLLLELLGLVVVLPADRRALLQLERADLLACRLQLAQRRLCRPALSDLLLLLVLVLVLLRLRLVLLRLKLLLLLLLVLVLWRRLLLVLLRLRLLLLLLVVMLRLRRVLLLVLLRLLRLLLLLLLYWRWLRQLLWLQQWLLLLILLLG
jgi:hypothetical protein